MSAKKPKTRKRAIYLVTDFGGDWEDAWERPVIAFTDKARAEECAAKRETRQYDEYGPIWDYEGSEVKENPARRLRGQTGGEMTETTALLRTIHCDLAAIGGFLAALYYRPGGAGSKRFVPALDALDEAGTYQRLADELAEEAANDPQ